ncbi:pilus assembly protein TadG-related protein [Streptomyces sp. bgisy060]|uniref:pilus assembly protein TadG-related protein n=1 Tax=Streptomyces sp. bgisy060 TaxID=3413775 RepID=UPI003EBC5C12
MAGLLFLAFAYFVVGQAAVVRNGAQTAADAAALAAAQDARDQLRREWMKVISDPERWEYFLQGRVLDEYSACQEAGVLAARNGATVPRGGCVSLNSEHGGFVVTVHTSGTVGRSVIPGTDSRHGVASARALIEPKCSLYFSEDHRPEGSPVEPGEDGDQEFPDAGISCEGDIWIIDPDSPKLPSAKDLFSVRLASVDE